MLRNDVNKEISHTWKIIVPIFSKRLESKSEFVIEEGKFGFPKDRERERDAIG